MVRTLISSLLTSVFLVSTASAQEAEIHRYATLPLGAEVTGLFVTENDLFFNVQHPNETNSGINRGTIGVVPSPDFTQSIGLPMGIAKETVQVAGGVYTILGQSGLNGLAEIRSIEGELMFVSSNPDFNGVVALNDDASEAIIYTNWEERPGGMSAMHIVKVDGKWTVQRTEMLDFSSVGGTWVNCFGTMSPWGAPISSEELYFDETADWWNPEFKYYDSNVLAMNEYLGYYGNPYRYGWNVEIVNPASIETATPVKLTAMGRFSHENVAVMNDQKTVYQSDDGGHVVFFKFIADNKADLSVDTLYAAKATQKAHELLSLEWIKLAHATQYQVDAWIAEYDGATAGISDEEVAIWARGDAVDDRVAFLESRKAAKAKGATAEFNKMM